MDNIDLERLKPYEIKRRSRKELKEVFEDTSHDKPINEYSTYIYNNEGNNSKLKIMDK